MATILLSSVEILIIIIIIIIIIYKTETFETPTIFHVSTILKKKKTFLKPGIIKNKKKKKNTQKFQLKKIAKSLKLENFLLPKTKTR